MAAFHCGGNYPKINHGHTLPMVNISDAATTVGVPIEFVYVCVSPQLPNVFKVGETHRQTPQQRAKQFPGVDKRVTWTVLRAFASPDSKYSERLVHARLNALRTRVDGHRELFTLHESELFSIIEQSIAVTPHKPPSPVRRKMLVAVPDEAGPWQEALALPMQYQGQPGITLAHAMALAAGGARPLYKRLLDQGVELVYPDPENPHFLVHRSINTKLSEWLKMQAITWESLGIPEEALSKKLKCTVQGGL
jgi:hypothetical protein